MTAQRARTVIAGTVFVVLVLSSLTDDYFRDEFYYLACARRLAWGYVDHPPLSVLLLRVVTGVFGDSLLILRTLSAAIAAASVWLTGSIARRLGGDTFAQVLAMVAAAVSPALLANGTFYSLNVIEVLVWTAAALLLMDAIERPGRRTWALLGVVLGLGLLNKISVLWLCTGMAVGLLLTARPLLATAGPWLAAAIAAALFLPHVAWQIANDWPTLEFIRNASAEKMQRRGPVEFLLTQILNMHPLTAPVWMAGLAYLLAATAARRFRALGFIYIVTLAILLANPASRSGYLTPAYPVLFAAGGVALQSVLVKTFWRRASVAVLVIGGAVTFPFAVPVLPTGRYVAYAALAGQKPKTEEKKDVGRLPQFFADREGWREFVGQVVVAWDRLSPDEKAVAIVLVGNYGEAGAIERLARDHGIPVISGHNNYWLWGPGPRAADVVLVVSDSRERQEARFESVEDAGRISCGDCMPYENGLSIFIGRGLRRPLAAMWPDLKHYD